MVENKIRKFKERGFSLIEILVAVLVVGILAAIVVPVFMNQQREAQAAQYKNDLVAAAFLINQEAVDNNGLYPTYLPNEIKNNPRTKSLIYSYSAERIEFCIQANTPVGKFFIGSKDYTKTTDVACTQEYLADGTDTPWSPPTLPTPPMPSVSLSWATNASKATANISIPTQACTLQPEDQAEWGSSVKLQYRYVVTNYDRGGTAFYTAWSNSPTASTLVSPEDSWLPTERIAVQAQLKCIISNGTDYAYTSKFGTAKLDTIPNFALATPTFTTSSAAWQSNQVVKVAATWNTLNCPLGTPKYNFDAVSATTGAHIGWSDPADNVYSWATTAPLLNSDPGFQADGKVKISLVVKCVLPNGHIISSPARTANLEAGLLAPSAPQGLSSQWVQPSNVTPSRIVWNAVTCAEGTPQYQLRRTAPSAWTGSWQTGVNSDQTHVVGTTYTYNVLARCMSGSLTSVASSASANHTFTAENRPPNPPAAPTGLKATTSANASLTPDTVSWNAVTCAWGSPQYLLTRTSPTGWNSGWMTDRTDLPPVQAGTTYTFTVSSRCIDGALTSSQVTSSGLTFTVTNVVPDAPVTPTGFGNNNAGTAQFDNNRLTWSAVTCVDSSPQYIVRQVIKNGTTIAEASRPTSAWMTTNYYNLPDSWVPAGSTIKFEVAAKCVSSANVSSPSSAYGTSASAQWTTSIPGPSEPRSASLDTGGTMRWAAPATTCAAGTSIQYYMWEGGWNSGWMSDRTSRYRDGWDPKGGITYSSGVVARCVGPNATSNQSGQAVGSVWYPWTSAPTTYHSDGNCSNFRSGPGTNYGVYSCQGGGHWLNAYNVCNASGFTWVRTDWGWTTTINLSNVNTSRIQYGC